jgi:hypothetical protein
MSSAELFALVEEYPFFERGNFFVLRYMYYYRESDVISQYLVLDEGMALHSSMFAGGVRSGWEVMKLSWRNLNELRLYIDRFSIANVTLITFIRDDI